MDKFQLDKEFVNKFKDKKVNFGFNGVGELVYYRSYSRLKPNGINEKWYETVERVVNGIYNIQKKHIDENILGWNANKAQISAQEMYVRMFEFKFLPPGRGLFACGSSILDKGVNEAMFNCAFITTKNIDKDFTKPFVFMADMSMCGVGVGFDILGANKVVIKAPNKEKKVFIIPDSREGWVESIKLLIDSYNNYTYTYEFDYSLIRAKGEPIKTFGGIAPGPQPLIDLHLNLRKVLDNRINENITITDITDMMNYIGVCVVSGNIRRSAQIALGDTTDEYLDLKNYDKNPHRSLYGWTSNNSIICDNNTDYTEAAKRTSINGEPGYVFLDNIRKYSRTIDPIDNKDILCMGTNPCSEQSLESEEICNLVETFPANHTSLEDYKRTLKFAYLYGKTVTLLKTRWEETNKVILRNRRIGLSQTGIAQFLENHTLEEYRIWCTEGYNVIQKYDTIYSSWFCIPKSIKTTSIKPSGSVSLLAGATPGMHYPEDKFYIRNIRVPKDSKFSTEYKKAGYLVQEDLVDSSSDVISIPVKVNCRIQSDVSIYQQVLLCSFIQRYWADNQVSCTITFKPEEAKEIKHILEFFKYELKSISFLPKVEGGAYEQMVYESIDENKYNSMMSNIKDVDLTSMSTDSSQELFCDNDSCVLV
ncbi:MAG: hypothetical protein K1X33_06520 [Methanobacteriaceae archaeon]|nr:hypothetical protein [Methanobacteriaceae archaeon]RTK94084.1 MAG: fused protease/ribonucleoside-triphosphate reductase [Neisseriaceae bacterium]